MLFVAEALHNMPVGQMGNYQEYLKRMPTPLREIESAPVRQHMFGNPFKIDKRMIIDEADIDLIGGQGKGRKEPNPNAGAMSPTQVPVSSINNINRGVKRKAGPIPKDYVFTPYKFRRRSIYDDDSSSDGYFSSTPSSPNPYNPSSPIPDAPMYSYSEPVLLQQNGRLSDEIPPVVNNILPESFSSLERLIETSTQNLPYTKPTTNGINSSYTPPAIAIVPTIKPHEDVPRVEIPSENKAIVKIEQNNSVIHEVVVQIPVKVESPIVENGTSPLPSTTHLQPDAPQKMIVTNHKTSKSKKNVDGHVKAKPGTPPPEKAEPPPVDDENTRQKNLTLRDELYVEIRRPILSKSELIPYYSKFLAFRSLFYFHR